MALTASDTLNKGKSSFYPTALKGCLGIVFTHGYRVGGGKKFVWAVSQKPWGVGSW